MKAVDKVDFNEVRGHHLIKRAIEVAVTGNHGLAFIGPPTSGQSTLAKLIPTIMPPLSRKEAVETATIHQLSGLLDNEHAVCTCRPFRAPFPTCSKVELIGDAIKQTPGEISLAHNGVLFLDGATKFLRSGLEALFLPMKDRKVTLKYATGYATFPANFILVASMSPCDCGFFGSPKRKCRCSPKQVEKYRARISGSLLDCLDVHVEIVAVKYKQLSSDEPAESSADIQKRIVRAWEVQRKRFAGNPKCHTNAGMSSNLLKAHCKLSAEGQELLRHAIEELQLNARAHDRILRISRSIADLAQSETIEPSFVMEAIQYRTMDRNLWL